MKRNLKIALAATGVVVLAATMAVAQTKKTRLVADNATAPPQQPLYSDFRVVRLGMTAEEVRSGLGNPVLKDDEMDYFVLSENLTAQIVYDQAHKAKAISVDYAGGVGAPGYRAVVGPELQNRADGSAYQMVRYPAQGFWVSYNRSTGPLFVVTITIQKM
jgi:hypothetical protein